jgi:NAD(P)-dependent dehydrogenase (short-subunit alcohol dehydrogenase family)
VPDPAEPADPDEPTEPTEPDVDPLGAFDLTGKVAVVTGASSGLGRRFARVLDAAGARVVVAARRAERLDALVAGLSDAVAVPCDVTLDADLERLTARALDVAGRVDVLVNNAGVSGPMPAEDEPLDHFRQLVEVNLIALFRLTQLVGRSMLDQGSGSIVNIASILGLVASSPIKEASYTAAKGGVVNLTRQLGAEWARRGVRVNAIAPGWFPTEMTADMWTDDASLAYIARNAPMGRGGRPHELDGALLYLASDASSYVTGQILAVDGGWTAR